MAALTEAVVAPARPAAGASPSRSVAAAWLAPAAIAIALAGLPAMAPAQDASTDGAASDEGTDTTAAQNVAAEKAESLLRVGRYRDALPLFEELSKKEETNSEYRAKYALCLYETGNLEQAQKIYEQVLSKDRDASNVVALVQMARIKARLHERRGITKEEQDRLKGEATQELITAARYGANCLRAIGAYPELKQLFLNDIDLKLSLISAPQTPRNLRQKRDPFQDPRPKVSGEANVVREPTGPGTERRLTEAEQRQMVQQLTALMRELKDHVKANNYEEVSRVFFAIEGIMKDADAIDLPQFVAAIQSIEIELKDQAFIVKRLLLSAFYQSGEKMVNSMEIALSESDHHRVFEEWQSLNRHARRMVETDASFQQPAERLLSAGQVFYDKAKVLEEIDKFSFAISGIVVGGGVSAAIINGRVVAENDPVFGVDHLPIEGLRVVNIKRQRVRFRYKDTDFERRLESTAAPASRRSPGATR